jgi:hypothetical protein
MDVRAKKKEVLKRKTPLEGSSGVLVAQTHGGIESV